MLDLGTLLLACVMLRNSRHLCVGLIALALRRGALMQGGVLLIGAPLLLILLSLPEAQSVHSHTHVVMWRLWWMQGVGHAAEPRLRFRASQSAANSAVTKAEQAMLRHDQS